LFDPAALRWLGAGRSGRFAVAVVVWLPARLTSRGIGTRQTWRFTPPWLARLPQLGGESGGWPQSVDGDKAWIATKCRDCRLDLHGGMRGGQLGQAASLPHWGVGP
jgi:hypothetical protein